MSIIAAPLAAIDRRALSQAWYSALHLAHENSKRAQTPPKPPLVSTVVTTRRASRETSTTRHFVTPSCSMPARRAERVLLGDNRASTEPRPGRERPPLARAIGNAFFNPGSTVKRATFSLSDENGRVHVVLQTKGSRGTLVALCPPQMHDVVARELSRARLVLRARGLRCS